MVNVFSNCQKIILNLFLFEMAVRVRGEEGRGDVGKLLQITNKKTEVRV